VLSNGFSAIAKTLLCRRGFARLTCLICAVLLWSSLGWSHATLLHTEPNANTKLDDPPGKVSLSFNERVEAVFNSVRVVNGEGKRVDRGQARIAGGGDQVEVDLQPLTDGPYAVFWKINSADGHQVQGSFGFGVRAEPPDETALAPPPVSEQQAFSQWYRPMVRWLGLTAMVVWLGGIGFLILVFWPSLANVTEPAAVGDPMNPAFTRIRNLIWAASAIWALSEVLGLAGQAVLLAGVPFASVLSPAVMGAVLMGTNFGVFWIVRVIAGLLLLVSCYANLRVHSGNTPNHPRRKLWTIPAALLGGLLLLTIPLTGHAGAVQEWTAVAVAIDWVHLAATAIWIGGLVHFAVAVIILRRSSSSSDVLSRLALRFSQVAKVCVIALLATGIYSAYLHLPSLLSFFSTDYGRVLLIKLAVIVPILIIAALNWKRVLPALSGRDNRNAASQKWIHRFKGLLRTEAALGLLVLALVAVLTNLPPATTVVAAGPATLIQQNGSFKVGLKIDPNRVGRNQALVTLTDAQGQRISRAKRVMIYLRSREMDMGLETVEARPSPDGNYQADVALSMGGRWLISVEVSPPQGDTFVTEFKLSSAF